MTNSFPYVSHYTTYYYILYKSVAAAFNAFPFFTARDGKNAVSWWGTWKGGHERVIRGTRVSPIAATAPTNGWSLTYRRQKWVQYNATTTTRAAKSRKTSFFNSGRGVTAFFSHREFSPPRAHYIMCAFSMTKTNIIIYYKDYDGDAAAAWQIIKPPPSDTCRYNMRQPPRTADESRS